MRIRAAVFYGADQPFGIEDVELDDPRPDEIVIRFSATGICHTDLTATELLASAGPIVLGHEGAGIVEAIGSEVADVTVGDHVVASYRSCGRCTQCVAGRRTYCAQFGALNFSGSRPDGTTTLRRADGRPLGGSFFGQSSFATHGLAYEDNVVRVPDATDLTLAGPFGCAFQTGAGVVLNVLRPAAAHTFAVFGTGGVGLAAIMAAVDLGLPAVIAVDPVPGRRALALQLGATHALDPNAGDVVAEIVEATGGGVDSAFDTTGVPEVISGAFASLAPAGTLALVAAKQPEIPVDLLGLIAGGRSIRGVIEGDALSRDFIPRLLELYATGRFPVDRLIRSYPMDQVNDAVADMRSGVTIKPILAMA